MTIYKNGNIYEQEFREGIPSTELNFYLMILFLKLELSNAKEKNIKVSGEDTKEGLVVIVSVKVPEPQFQGQTKGKLGSSYVRPAVQKLTYEKLAQYFEENPADAKNVVQKILLSARAREASKRANEKNIFCDVK